MLTHEIGRINTNMMTCISIEAKHVIMFSKLRNDIFLLACNKVYKKPLIEIELLLKNVMQLLQLF